MVNEVTKTVNKMVDSGVDSINADDVHLHAVTTINTLKTLWVYIIDDELGVTIDIEAGNEKIDIRLQSGGEAEIKLSIPAYVEDIFRYGEISKSASIEVTGEVDGRAIEDLAKHTCNNIFNKLIYLYSGMKKLASAASDGNDLLISWGEDNKITIVGGMIQLRKTKIGAIDMYYESGRQLYKKHIKAVCGDLNKAMSWFNNILLNIVKDVEGAILNIIKLNVEWLSEINIKTKKFKCGEFEVEASTPDYVEAYDRSRGVRYSIYPDYEDIHISTEKGLKQIHDSVLAFARVMDDIFKKLVLVILYP